MLEIFTKEVPYKECTNPAQIYKKVSSGIEPESLQRIRSSTARDFVRQCLGTTDENGAIVRPSASYLLAHPFLEKRENDDSEVLVDPPLRERALSEQKDGSGEIQPTVYAEPPALSDSERTRSGENLNKNPPNENSISAGPSATGDGAGIASQPNSPPAVPINPSIRQSSVESNDNRAVLDVGQNPIVSPQRFSEMAQPTSKTSFDFESMPEAEINMKPVTVLMGRGQELDESDQNAPIPMMELPPSVAVPAPAPASAIMSTQHHQQTVPAQPVVNNDNGSGNEVQDAAERRASQLSSEGQSSIPAKSNYSLVAVVVEDNNSPHVFPNDIIKLQMTMTVGNQEQHIQFGFHLVQDDAIQVAKEMVTELNLPQEAVLETSEIISSIARKARIQLDTYKNIIQQQQVAPPHAHPAVSNMPNVAPMYAAPNSAQPPVHVPYPGNYDNHLERSIESLPSVPMEPQQMLPPSVNNPAAFAQNNAMMHQSLASYDNKLDHSIESMPSQMGVAITNDAVPQQGLANINITKPQFSVHAAPSTSNVGLMPPSHLTHPPPNNLPSQVTAPLHQQQQQHPTYSESGSGVMSVSNPIASTQKPMSQHLVGMHVNVTAVKSLSGTTSTTQSSNQDMSRSQCHDLLGSTIELQNENEEEEDEIVNSVELLQLKQEHDKKIQRARKAFDTRMENLQRSKEEKEALHLQTLKKHEKEKAALEKRLKMAEMEQLQRLQKLEKEFIEQREIAKQSIKVNLPPSDEDDLAIFLESKIENVNLTSVSSQGNLQAGNTISEQGAKAPSPTPLSQDGGSDII